MTSRPSFPSRCTRDEQGVVLILAIFAVALLTALAVGLTSAVRVELQSARTGLDRMQGLFLAQAGIDVARAILVYEDLTFDALTDPWGPAAKAPLDKPQRLKEGYYRVRVYDACGRIDINHADQETLLRLTGDPLLVEEILKWRAGEADDDQYLSLPYPYRPRQGAFQSVGELLLVEGMTPELFFGTEEKPGLVDLVTVEALSPNTNAKGEWRVPFSDLLSALGALTDAQIEDWLTRHHPELLEVADLQTWKYVITYRPPGSPTGTYASLGQLAEVLASYGALEALDYVSLTPERYLSGLVNVNTAPLEVLALLPGSSYAVAAAIVKRRAEQPFVSLGEVAQFLLSQEEGAATMAQMIGRVTTKSSSFVIEAMGSPGEGRPSRTVRAEVRRVGGNVWVVREYEPVGPLPPWQEATQVAMRRYGDCFPVGRRSA